MLVKRRMWVGEERVVGFERSPARGLVGFDSETTGTDPWGTRGLDRDMAPARPFFFSFCDPKGRESWARCPVDARTREVHISPKVRDAVETYLADERVVKAVHNAAFDTRMCRASKIRVRGVVQCTMVRQHVIRPNEPTFKLKPLCKKYLKMETDDQEALHSATVRARREAKKNGWAIHEEVAADYWLTGSEVEKYGCRDAKRAVALFLTQREHLNKYPSLQEVLADEMELADVLAEMEDRGVALDRRRLAELRKFYLAIIVKHQGVISHEAHGINLRSSKQMTALWFGERGYIPLRYSDAACQACRGEGRDCRICLGTGRNPSADGDFLAHVGVKRDADGELVPGDPLAWAILHHQAARSMLDFVDQYDGLAVVENGYLVIHPNFKQVGARTARMSCTSPNLQNVASDESGKKKVAVPYRSREVFVPRAGHLFYLTDYSQIEVWVLALCVKKYVHDSALLDMLAAGGDAHQIVADAIWGHLYDAPKAKRDAARDPTDLNTDDLANVKAYKHARKRAKNLQFAVIYGGGRKKVAQLIGCSETEAVQFKDDYDERLPAVAHFMNWSIHSARRLGHVTSPYGRVYPLDPGLEYRAVNYLIQGTAATILKRAMVRVRQALRRLARGRARLLMSIHDELVTEVEEGADTPALRAAVVHAMQADSKKLGCPVPFPVSFSVAGERWSEAREVRARPSLRLVSGSRP